MSLYDELLAKTGMPVQSHFLYKKWLRYYLDFCHKYHFDPSTRQNISLFSNKLEEKNQNKQQKKKATHAISVFYEIGLPNSEKTGNNKVTAKKKGLSEPKTWEKLLTNADWTSVYNSLDAEIKITHYAYSVLIFPLNPL